MVYALEKLKLVDILEQEKKISFRASSRCMLLLFHSFAGTLCVVLGQILFLCHLVSNVHTETLSLNLTSMCYLSFL